MIHHSDVHERVSEHRTERVFGDRTHAGIAGAQGVDHGEQLCERGEAAAAAGGGAERLEGLVADAAGGLGQTGGGSSPDSRISDTIGSAAQAAGTPATGSASLARAIKRRRGRGAARAKHVAGPVTGQAAPNTSWSRVAQHATSARSKEQNPGRDADERTRTVLPRIARVRRREAAGFQALTIRSSRRRVAAAFSPASLLCPWNALSARPTRCWRPKEAAGLRPSRGRAGTRGSRSPGSPRRSASCRA